MLGPLRTTTGATRPLEHVTVARTTSIAARESARVFATVRGFSPGTGAM